MFSTNVEAYQFEKIHNYITPLLQGKCFVVIDESAKIKNGCRKKRGKRCGAKRTNTILDLFIDLRYKGILSGTPSPNSPFDLWSQFEFLKQNYFYP